MYCLFPARTLTHAELTQTELSKSVFQAVMKIWRDPLDLLCHQDFTLLAGIQDTYLPFPKVHDHYEYLLS